MTRVCPGGTFKPFSDMEHETLLASSRLSVKAMAFCHSDISGHYVNLAFGFIQICQDIYGKRHNVCMIFGTWCKRRSGVAAGEKL